MLILHRKPGEAIELSGGIRVVVVACDRRGVRLGVHAPASVNILRAEIVAQIARENQRAAPQAAHLEWARRMPALSRSA